MFLFFFFFYRKFQHIVSASNDSFLSSNQDTDYFLCKWRLNSRSFIQPLEILLVELTKTNQHVPFF